MLACLNSVACIITKILVIYLFLYSIYLSTCLPTVSILADLDIIKTKRNFPLLLQAFHEEYSRLYELSKEETTPQEDARLQHSLVYFFQNKAPNRIIERTLLEQFTDRNLSFDER